MLKFNILEYEGHDSRHELLLHRFPVNKRDNTLRAWDAADEFLINDIQESVSIDKLKHISIINDSFGSITCALAVLYPDAAINTYNDSYMGARGIEHNLTKNNLETTNIKFLNSLDLQQLPKERSDLIVLKIPRTHAYLDYILACVSKAMISHNAKFVSGAMVKLVTSATLKIFDYYFSDTKTSLARKKARLINANLVIDKTASQPLKLTKTINDSQLDFALTNYPNVFCREQIDIGARFFLPYLPKPEEGQKVIDLGCGNGVLGISIIKQYLADQKVVADNPPKVIFVDESYMAIESAKSSSANFLHSEQTSLVEFHIDHCLSDYLENKEHHNSVDKVVCNPPFHQQNSMLDDIAWQMFVDSKKALKRGGELLVVGNRHLDHRVKLTKLFGGCKIVGTNNKFTVFSATKK